LVSPGDDGHPRPARRGADGAENAAQVVELHPLLQDQAERKVVRPGPGDDEVVDRAVDGQRPDVPARKKERVDDIAVGGEGQPAPQPGRVAELGQGGVAEGRDDLAVDEIPHQTAAAPEFEADLRHGGLP
jgi:hypothetical protein